MGPVALDASVVVGFLGGTDAHHARAVEASARAQAASLLTFDERLERIASE
ncbi:MAG TPA: hypothetical protein VGR10_07905 [Thermoleophilaceae bacterium]|nr:hypothetical protein [Thermoleophilaceae bacterium]